MPPLRVKQPAFLAATNLLLNRFISYFKLSFIQFSSPYKTNYRKMSTDWWYTSNLPNDQTDLDNLVQWFREHDTDWMADALWLRYLKIGRQVYHPNQSDLAWEFREAHFNSLPYVKKKPRKPPPFTLEILPGIPPHDGIDRLSALPRDIRVEILSHLGLPDVRIDKCGNIVTAGHALSNLVLVSKGWRDQVEAFCGHSLLVWKHAAEAQRVNGDASKWVGWRELATYTANARMEYVFRMRKYCSVCARLTTELRLSSERPGRLICAVCQVDDCREHSCSDSDE